MCQVKCWVNTTPSGGTPSPVVQGGTPRGFAMGVLFLNSNARSAFHQDESIRFTKANLKIPEMEEENSTSHALRGLIDMPPMNAPVWAYQPDRASPTRSEAPKASIAQAARRDFHGPLNDGHFTLSANSFQEVHGTTKRSARKSVGNRANDSCCHVPDIFLLHQSTWYTWFKICLP